MGNNNCVNANNFKQKIFKKKSKKEIYTKVTVQLLMHISCEQGVAYDVQAEIHIALNEKVRLNVKSFLPYSALNFASDFYLRK